MLNYIYFKGDFIKMIENILNRIILVILQLLLKASINDYNDTASENCQKGTCTTFYKKFVS